MGKEDERRREQRLCYKWPVIFAEDFKKEVCEGLMVDVSSGGIAFLCKGDENCPQKDQKLTVHFSIPRSGELDSSEVVSITRTGRVCRVDNKSSLLRRVAIQFDKPLSLKPYEQVCIDLMQSEGSSS